jgi:thiol-disulfide isomerase/thioredoxin
MNFSSRPGLTRYSTLLWDCRIVAILAGSLWLGGVANSSPEREVNLTWRNGDELTGRLLPGSEGETIRFEASPFTDPLDLRPGQLGRIHFPAALATPEPATPLRFEVSLSNGDRLRGKLIGLDRDGVVLDCSPPLGIVSIRREAIARLGALNGEDLNFSGLGGLSEWTSSGRDRKTSDWFADLRGELISHQWSGNLFREIAFPEKVEVHFRASFQEGYPSLVVGLLRDPEAGPRLETWDRMLVLTYQSQFVAAMELTEATRELDLRLFWNQATGEVRLSLPSGKELAAISGARPEKPDAQKRRPSDPLHRGFFILNRTPGIRLLSLQVREWDGSPAPLIDLTRPRLRLRNEPVRFQIDDIRYSEEEGNIKVGTRAVPLTELLELTFPPSGPGPLVPEPSTTTRVAWQNGTTLSGRFLSIKPGLVSLLPPWAAGPVVASLEGAREIRFPENTEPLEAATDLLTSSGISLRGTMRLAPTGTKPPVLLSWQPPGALHPVPLSPVERLTITRNPLSEAGAVRQSSLSQARLYLADDEILAGRLRSITSEKVLFESRLTGLVEVPSAYLRALDTGTAGRILEGFKDSEWEKIEEVDGQIELAADTAVLKGGSVGNPSLLLGDRIRFNAAWTESYGAMTMRFFTSGPDSSTPSTDIIIAAQGNRLFVGRLNENGAFSFSGDQIPIVANRAAIDISATPEKIDVRIDGRNGISVKVDPAKISGNGLYFKMGGGWQGWNQENSVIEISQFRIESSPGSIPRRLIEPRAKEHLLSIPRALRNDIPTHLLIAPNGDLLRGNLGSGDETSLRFAAKDQTLEIPLGRVSNIIWLSPPSAPKAPDAPTTQTTPSKKPPGGKTAADTPETAEAGEGDPAGEPVASDRPAPPRPATTFPSSIADFQITHQLVLHDGTRLQLMGDRIEGNRLIGLSPVLGECRVAVENIREIRSGPPVALDEAPPMDLVVFNDWQTNYTPDPVLPAPGGTAPSPMIGKEAPSFELDGLDQTKFKLSDHRGKVVVLDFWATWCGPCVKAMPDVMAVVSAFPEGSVAFCAINQAESSPIVASFLQARKWGSDAVALDFNMKVSRAYQVDGIPHTVVIDPEGRIAWVHTGYTPELKRGLFEAIARTLSR